MLKHTYIFLLFLLFMSFSTHASAYRSPLNTKECALPDVEFDDGDSFSCAGEEVRVLGIDTPEITHEKHGIFEDQPYGKKAEKLTRNAMKKAKRILLVRDGKDKYGRTLAHVLLDGELLALKLIQAGLAIENISRHGDTHMPEFAIEIIEAASVSPKPKFEDPAKWREKNQKKSKSSR